ncbi:MAG: hypothetical protein GTO71_08290 [Woeseiaceae bacterium]|nr:hypothetical protein [Woeseiaceae bacterium]NIP21083.1 hypothetical protein [Woeseiaceae bacterium]NIS90055.1 hypothetical protein [Woeseiaceae bacterium]
MTISETTTTRLSLIGFLAILLVAWFCYRPALSGDFQLDDRSNLIGLANVEDLGSAVDFMLSGQAGPTGRPLALLTFALQADHWEAGAGPFLTVNVLIHLVNAALLAACLYLLTIARGVSRDRSAMVAAIAAGCWVLMPLLATASFLVIQRMTTLSASITLLGLLAYLFARGQVANSPRSALLAMSASLVLGTGLAIFSKETGLLLPLYVLVLEATVLSRPTSVDRRYWRAWQAAFLVLPTLVVIAYLLTSVDYPDWLITWRGFTAGERLVAESQILWVYLHKAVFGLPGELGIFLAGPTVSYSLAAPQAALSMAGWLVLLAGSVIWRRRYPLAALAVLWFLAGHSIESTIVPLELYFEHRNYLPIVGPVYALTAVLLLGAGIHRRVLAVLAPVYLVTSALFLYSFASMSGEPSTSSRYWAFRYPDSVRAVTTMASYQLTEEGPIRALDTLDQFVIRKPEHAYLRIQELNIRCMFLPGEAHDVVIEELRRELPTVEFTYTAGTMLSQLLDSVVATNCNGVGLEQVRELANVLQGNPHYGLVPGYNQFHHKLLAGIARQQDDFDTTVEELEKAISFQGSGELNMMIVTTLAGAGQFDQANAFISAALDDEPRNPLQRIAWRRNLASLSAYVDELERYSRNDE